MSASLVGSEMCIRDSPFPATAVVATSSGTPQRSNGTGTAQAQRSNTTSSAAGQHGRAFGA
eukprot:1006452-Alexandrium_andersonii.AAC.1